MILERNCIYSGKNAQNSILTAKKIHPQTDTQILHLPYNYFDINDM